MTYSYTSSVVNGYAQGMNDLAATILYVIEDEAQSFWCFKGLMEIVQSQFFTMCLPHLKTLQRLLQFMDPWLSAYLERIDANDMLFLFQSILLTFKREFEIDDVKLLWEVFWTNHLCPHFHLFFASAVVLLCRHEILEQEMDSQDLLMYFKNLQKHGKKVEDCLTFATRIYLYFDKTATATQKDEIFFEMRNLLL